MYRTFDNSRSTDARVMVVGLGITDVGELRPGLELAKALSMQKEVSVHVATHARFRSQVKDLGFKFEDCGIDPIEARKTTQSGKTLEASKQDSAALGIALKSFMDTLVANWIDAGVSLLVNGPSTRPDVVILASSAAVYCYMPICEENYIQVCILSASPCIPTMSFPPPRAFRGVQAVMRESTCTGQWAIYCQSVWRFLYRDAVDAQCKKHFKSVPHSSPFGPLDVCALNYRPCL
jgi:UDP:flavonoid glycosyltransferase YjiC (YdhE family)